MNRIVALILCAGLVGCAQSKVVTPLPGVIAPVAALPNIALAPGYKHLVFNWDYEDADLTGRGEGSARIAPPDSARVDLFLGGGMGGAAALVGDTLRTPGIDLIKRYLPPPAMLWAGLGRLTIPALPDTIVRAEGDVVRADIGRPVAWRVTVKHGQLIRLDRINDGRVIEWVTRDSTGSLEYQVPSARRRLTIKVTQSRQVGGFDSSIFTF
ncbi:MAG: hypothetical protein H0W69_05025 [Gemmatimonadaceae bacterium]|nr:hypothetical protein [Gemmatimonadaceae bacterium]MBA3656699.1 hypothetical protein [Gemmatimonadaceae bacterium]